MPPVIAALIMTFSTLHPFRRTDSPRVTMLKFGPNRRKHFATTRAAAGEPRKHLSEIVHDERYG
jgi:hypothetical protein